MGATLPCRLNVPMTLNADTDMASSTKHHPYALGVWEFLIWARRDHQKRFRGDAPRLFVIHPESFCDMLADERARQFAGWLYREPNGKYKFMGVEIREDSHAGQPYLINCRGEPELL